MATYDDYRRVQIEDGLIYQDFTVDLLWHTIGLAVVQYASRVYQATVGESRTGVEIKHDKKFAQTGNLWIETAEKARPRPGPFARSGIDRTDNTWLFVIGNYDTVFGFPKTFLRALRDSGRYPLVENRTHTSIGFKLPGAHAHKYAAFVLTPHAEQKIAKAIQLEDLGRLLHRSVTENSAQLSLFATEVQP